MSFEKRTKKRGPAVFAEGLLSMGITFEVRNGIPIAMWDGNPYTLINNEIARHNTAWRNELVKVLEANHDAKGT